MSTLFIDKQTLDRLGEKVGLSQVSTRDKKIELTGESSGMKLLLTQFHLAAEFTRGALKLTVEKLEIIDDGLMIHFSVRMA
jgi:hypothetical protein